MLHSVFFALEPIDTMWLLAAIVQTPVPGRLQLISFVVVM